MFSIFFSYDYSAMIFGALSHGYTNWYCTTTIPEVSSATTAFLWGRDRTLQNYSFLKNTNYNFCDMFLVISLNNDHVKQLSAWHFLTNFWLGK